jgi:hypothetical protein
VDDEDYQHDDSFFTHAREDYGEYEAFVYLGVEIVYTIRRPVYDFPAGLHDFGGWAFRQFSKRLAEVLGSGDGGT